MVELVELIEKGMFHKSDYQTKEDYFEGTFHILFKDSKVNNEFLHAICERERNYPTGMRVNDINVAIPHSEHQYVNEEAIIIDVFKNPVVFQNIENPEEKIEVSISFMLLLTKSHSHLRALQQLMILFQDNEVLQKIINCSCKEEVIEVINELNLNN